MSLVGIAIGTSFELCLRRQFPEFIYTDGNMILPDFETTKFFVEAKAGNVDYGFRLKKYQLDGFSKLDRPTSYIVGFHNTCGLLKFLEKENGSWMIKYCLKQLKFEQKFFVSQLIAERLWDKEMRVSKKSNVEYCVIKPRHFRNIIEDFSFKRGDSVFNVEDYYAIDRRDFLLKTDLVSKNSFILHKDHDSSMIEYLRMKELL